MDLEGYMNTVAVTNLGAWRTATLCCACIVFGIVALLYGIFKASPVDAITGGVLLLVAPVYCRALKQYLSASDRDGWQEPIDVQWLNLIFILLMSPVVGVYLLLDGLKSHSVVYVLFCTCLSIGTLALWTEIIRQLLRAFARRIRQR